MNCKKGKKQTKESIETNPELTQMSEWADKNIKIEIITVFCIFKTLIREKILKKKTVIKFLEVKTTVSEVKWYHNIRWVGKLVLGATWRMVLGK